MSIDFDNLSDLPDSQLMAAWHERMVKAYSFMHIRETGTKKQRQANTVPILKLNGEMGLLKDEMMRRECDPVNANELDSLIKLNLN